MKETNKYMISGVISFVLVFAMAVLVYRSQLYKIHSDQLVTSLSVQKYLDNHGSMRSNRKEVPTGLFIESLNFVDANSVHISGYVWQRHPKKNISIDHIGLVFPEAISLNMHKAYERMNNNSITIGWYFEGEFVQRFNYNKFPFDYKIVWIRMWNKKFDSNVVLTPDLDGYDKTNINDVLGIDDGIVLRDYSLKESYFNYKMADYDTDFGIRAYIGQKQFPELRFNVVIKRNMMQAVMIHMIPISMVLVFTFFVLLALTKKKDNVSILGCNYLNTQRSITFLLFIVVVAHVQLRNYIFGQSLTFLDYIYFIVYLSLLYVSLVACLMLREQTTNRLFNWLEKDNFLLAKLAFFPIIFGIMFLCCLVTFQAA